MPVNCQSIPAQTHITALIKRFLYRHIMGGAVTSHHGGDLPFEGKRRAILAVVLTVLPGMAWVQKAKSGG